MLDPESPFRRPGIPFYLLCVYAITDGIDDGVRIVELDILRAVRYEDLLCIGREGK
jgi:hypothetical protein